MRSLAAAKVVPTIARNAVRFSRAADHAQAPDEVRPLRVSPESNGRSLIATGKGARGSDRASIAKNVRAPIDLSRRHGSGRRARTVPIVHLPDHVPAASNAEVPQALAERRGLGSSAKALPVLAEMRGRIGEVRAQGALVVLARDPAANRAEENGGLSFDNSF
jgi:hypothetical protein